MLHTKDLTFSYGNNRPLQFPDVQCSAGEHWLILGSSGSGKTTLLHLLGGLRRPGSGSVNIAGTAIESLSPAELDQFRGKHIGLIFQQSHFVRSLSVSDNLRLAQQLAGMPVKEDRITELLTQLNVLHKKDELPSRLSVGEQQRVAIARAIVNQPEVILADEPTSALDDHNAGQVVQLLKEQAKAVNALLLIVTHDNRLIAQFDKQIRL